MTTTIKRIVLALVVLALPVAWLWLFQERPPEPPTPPPAKVVQPKHKRMITVPVPTNDVRIGRQAVIETGKGNIIVGLYEKDAKITTKNFISLVESEFYDGLIFHRVEPGTVIQTGDPTGTGSGGSEKTIPLEASPALNYNTEGMLGMARTYDPNSASSQFFINLKPYPAWNKNYAVFGKVLKGMDVAKLIRVGDKVNSIYLIPTSKQSAPDRRGT